MTLLIILLPLVLLAFWAWMFWDFANNESITGDERLMWLVAFIVLSILTAGYYYINVYRERH